MRKMYNGDYGKWNIAVVIYDPDFQLRLPSRGGNSKAFEEITSALPLGILGSAAYLITATISKYSTD